MKNSVPCRTKRSDIVSFPGTSSVWQTPALRRSGSLLTDLVRVSPHYVVLLTSCDILRPPYLLLSRGWLFFTPTYPPQREVILLDLLVEENPLTDLSPRRGPLPPRRAGGPQTHHTTPSPNYRPSSTTKRQTPPPSQPISPLCGPRLHTVVSAENCGPPQIRCPATRHCPPQAVTTPCDNVRPRPRVEPRLPRTDAKKIPRGGAGDAVFAGVDGQGHDEGPGRRWQLLVFRQSLQCQTGHTPETDLFYVHVLWANSEWERIS